MNDEISPLPILAVDLQRLAIVLSVPLNELEAMADAKAWLTGHLPVPVEVGASGRTVHRLWALDAIERWLLRDRALGIEALEPRLVDYRGLAALLSYSPSKVQRLVAEAASTGWDDVTLPRPIDLPGKRMWSVSAVDEWLNERLEKAQSW